jgi:hypothetical protein
MLEVEQRFGPDQAEIVHTFDDGWTIRRVTRTADLAREGALMGHCLRSMVPERGPDLPDVYSLRDRDNYPHTTLFYEPVTRCAVDFSDHGDRFPIAPEHLFRLLDWLPPADEVVLGCHLPSPFACAANRLTSPRPLNCSCLGVDDGRMVFRVVKADPPTEEETPDGVLAAAQAQRTRTTRSAELRP